MDARIVSAPRGHVAQFLRALMARDAFVDALPPGSEKLPGWGHLAKKISVHQFLAPGTLVGPDTDGVLLVLQGGLRLEPDLGDARSCELFGCGDIANTLGHAVSLLVRARAGDGEMTAPVRTDTYIARKGTSVGVIPAAAYLALCQQSPAWLAHLEALAATVVARAEERLHSFNYLTAEERMRQVMTHRPGLISSFSQKDLAEYVGITPVALCRIVKRLRVSEPHEDRSDGRHELGAPGAAHRRAG